jgi:hypothetical protein
MRNPGHNPSDTTAIILPHDCQLPAMAVVFVVSIAGGILQMTLVSRKNNGLRLSSGRGAILDMAQKASRTTPP